MPSRMVIFGNILPLKTPSCQFSSLSFHYAGIKGEWLFPEGKTSPENEVFKKDTGEILLKVNPKFYRPAEVHKLCGDPSLAESKLGWKRKTDFNGLVKKMYDSDYSSLSK